MNDQQDLYDVCLFKDEGEYFYLSSGPVGAFQHFPNMKDRAEDSEVTTPSPVTFEKLHDEFQETMLAYLDMLPVIAVSAHAFMKSLTSSPLISNLEKQAVHIEKLDDRDVYTVPLEVYRRLDGFRNSFDSLFIISAQLPMMMIIGCVSALEHMMSNLTRYLLETGGEGVFGKDEKVNIADVLRAESFDEFRKKLIEDKIYSIFMGGLDSQVTEIERLISASEPIAKGYKDWKNLLELSERRNLFAHAGGVVNQRYLDNGKRYGYLNNDSPGLGEGLRVGTKYMRESLHILCEFGIGLIQVAWRKRSPDQSDSADDAIGELGYELIERGEYKLAAKILELAAGMRGVHKERRLKMNMVNLANAYRLSGDEEKANRLVESLDLSASHVQFQICMAAVEGKVDQVCDLLRSSGDHANISANALEEWPVFYHVRDDEKFGQTFRELFGRDYVAKSRTRRTVVSALQQIRDLETKTGDTAQGDRSSIADSDEDEDEGSPSMIKNNALN